jgi:hypothetical protein
MATETVLGVFAHVDTTVRALEELRARGYHDLTVYTPLPVHEIEEVLERDRPVSRVRLFTLIGGLTGIASAFILTIWSSMVWGLVTGGKYMQPVSGGGISGSSLPPFFIIAFELMVLFAGFGRSSAWSCSGGSRGCGRARATMRASPTTASAWPSTAPPNAPRRSTSSSEERAPKK